MIKDISFLLHLKINITINNRNDFKLKKKLYCDL